jgi:hypothetical protein
MLAIHEHEIDAAAGHRVHGRPAVDHDAHAMAELLGHQPRELAVQRVILGHEDPRTAAATGPPRAS